MVDISSDSKKSNTIVDYLMEIPLFDGLGGDELRFVARYMNYFEIEEGAVLFREGDFGDYVCFVVEGELYVLKKAPKTGEDIIIATVSKNRSIGEMSVIDNTRRSATVKASTNSAVISLTKRGFDLILEESPIIGIRILKQIARLMSMNLRKTSSLLADSMFPIA